MKNLFVGLTMVLGITLTCALVFKLLLPTYTPIVTSDVVLYSAKWCGYCDKTRDLLRQQKVVFTELDIESSSQIYNEYKALGGNGIPLTNFGGTIVQGYNPQAFSQQLQRMNQLSQAQ